MNMNETAESMICLTGPKNAQNSLLAMFLERETGVKCVSIGHMSDINTCCPGSGNAHRLVLWDCYGRDAEDCIAELTEAGKRTFSANLVALFNIVPTLGIEHDALSLGVRGIFYIQDPLEHLARGVAAILKGELWVPRRIMGECIKKTVITEGLKSGNGAILSSRENQIIGMLSSGLSNEQIARNFCISSYTVKTHLHNIFKKIKVRGRVEAAMWATKNL